MPVAQRFPGRRRAPLAGCRRRSGLGPMRRLREWATGNCQHAPETAPFLGHAQRCRVRHTPTPGSRRWNRRSAREGPKLRCACVISDVIRDDQLPGEPHPAAPVALPGAPGSESPSDAWMRPSFSPIARGMTHVADKRPIHPGHQAPQRSGRIQPCRQPCSSAWEWMRGADAAPRAMR